MLDKDAINDLGRKITDLLPEGSKQIREDLESNVRTLLQNGLSKMNLVTREEFDVQAALLARTRERLEELEQKLKDLSPPAD